MAENADARPGYRSTRSFADMPQGAFSHPYDRVAISAVGRLPLIEWALNQVSSVSYEKLQLSSLLAKSVRISAKAYPEILDMLEDACAGLDIQVPECFVIQDARPYGRTIGSDHPAVMISTGMLEILDGREMFALLAHNTSHIRCEHLPYLTLCDFLGSTTNFLGIIGSPLQGPRLMLEEWRRAAELSCDRGALLVTGDLDALVSMIAKSGGARDLFGGVDSDALIEQNVAFVESIRGLSMGRLYRTIMYLDTEAQFAPLRVAAISKWRDGEEFAALNAGKWGSEEQRSEETSGVPLWGGFAPGAQQEDVEYDPESAGKGGAVGDFMSGIRSVAGSAGSMASQGAGAFKKAVFAFINTLQDNFQSHEMGDTAGSGEQAVKIKVTLEE